MPDDPICEKQTGSASSWQESLRQSSPYLGLGMQLALALVFFVGVGYLIDRWLGTVPWGIIGGALVGMVAGFIHLVRMSNTLSSQSQQAKRKREDREVDDRR